MDALQGFDPYPMVRGAAAFLVRHGPVTEQERWEEASGYSPATLASNIAALLCAAEMAHNRRDEALAQYLQEFADYLECHVEEWTVTTQGALLPDVGRHYIRINPADPDDPDPHPDPNRGTLHIRNQPPGAPTGYPAKDVVDAGFLDLVRYGVRAAGSELIEDSLRVVDATLRVELPGGSAWRRYNHDGYGQRDDGGPFVGWGVGRAWPLLTGERGHYELAAGRDARPYLRAMERFATPTGLLSEQLWDAADLPRAHMCFGRPTGAAMPLMWAHAEYIKLLRSVSDGIVFDHLPIVAERYLGARRACRGLELWKPGRRPDRVRPDHTLRVQAERPFRLRWTRDEWQTAEEALARATSLGVHFADLKPAAGQRAPFRFTFYWTDEQRWEGRDYEVAVVDG